MMEQKYNARFLGANTPEGFISLFDELYDPAEDWRAYIIKGGPGTGKSRLMRRVADELEQAGYTAQRVLCSSDPDSLDGVIFPQIRACIADGTSPHVIEPRFPGAVEELVNLGDYWDAEQLRVHAEGIRAAALKNSAYHQRCIGFLSAAGRWLMIRFGSPWNAPIRIRLPHTPRALLRGNLGRGMGVSAGKADVSSAQLPRRGL